MTSPKSTWGGGSFGSGIGGEEDGARGWLQALPVPATIQSHANLGYLYRRKQG